MFHADFTGLVVGWLLSWVAGLNMVGSWLWQGLICRFSTVFDRVGIWLMFTCGWWGPWAEEDLEVAQERVDVSLVQIMAQHRSFALLISRVTLLLTPLQTSPHKRCLCCPSLTIQIRSKAHPPADTVTQIMYKRIYTWTYTNSHTQACIGLLSHTFITMYIQESLHMHTGYVNPVSVCINLYKTQLILDRCIIIKHWNYIHNSSFKRKDHIHPNDYPYYQWKT